MGEDAKLQFVYTRRWCFVKNYAWG